MRQIRVRSFKDGGRPLLQVVVQTRRENRFAPSHTFCHKGFWLSSVIHPQVSRNGLYVRGGRKESDKDILFVHSGSWLKRCLAAVEAYNEKYARKSCSKKHVK